ncbi:MAG TPA: MCE family protein [Mycobacteriales bacterium]
MTQFRERNPIPIAIIGIAVVIVLILIAFNANKISFIPGGGGHTVKAYFQESSNLQHDDDVRIAGIKVGTVDTVKLAMFDENGTPTQVAEVVMTVDKGVHLSADSMADIKIKTLLGAMYVDITPGTSSAKLSKPINATAPSHTPLIVTDAFEGLATRVDKIDTSQLAAAFTTLSQDFANTPDEVSSTLKGLAAVSQTIASRDAELHTLLTHAQGVTTALASRDQQVSEIIRDGQTVLALVNQQRDVIHQLLVNSVTLSQQLSALVAENQAQLGPALTNLKATLAILTKDQTQLDSAIYLLAPFIRDFGNTLGNGKWFDGVVINLNSLGKAGCFNVGSTGTGNAPAGCY